MEPFVHLHAHTSYSVLDGAVRVADLVAGCVRLGMPAVAVTDHGNLHGAAEFHRLAVAAGITPVIGYEAYVAPGSRFDRDRGPFAHHTMWARNAVGLRNLAAVSSAAFAEGRSGRWPRVDVDLVAAHAEGLMGTTGCASGEVSTRLRLGREREALEVAALWRDVYEDFYVELVDHGVDRRVREGLVRIAAALDVEVVVTNDVHYLRPEDAAAHDALAAFRSGKTVRDPSLVRLAGSGHHLRSAREMHALDSSDVWRRGCRTTLEVAGKVDPTGMFAPAPPVVSDELFRDRVRAGLRRRFPGGVDGARVEHEVDELLRRGSASALLVVADLVEWAAGAGVRLGPGVGSGSLVAYALGVADVDPVERGTAFPDVLDLGVEVDERRRDEVVRHLEERWGARRVAEFALVKDSHPDLAGLVRHVGVEPAAVVVAGDEVPLWTRPGDGAVVTQFDLATCRALGLVEVDVVGSAELAVVDDALRGVVLNGKPAVVPDGESVADWTTRLAADHPAEFLAAVLDADPVKAADAVLLPPDVNESRGGFTAVGEAVRYGLGAVRHVEPEVVAAIVRAREERGRFADFFDYLRKVDAPACAKPVVEALVKAGAFDSLGHPRKGLHLVHADAVDAVLAAKRAEAGGQFDLFGIEEFEATVPDERWEPEEQAAFQREVLGP